MQRKNKQSLLWKRVMPYKKEAATNLDFLRSLKSNVASLKASFKNLMLMSQKIWYCPCIQIFSSLFFLLFYYFKTMYSGRWGTYSILIPSKVKI
jgi:hypothetical protein